MKREAQKAAARKPYEKPEIRQVKLETVEATLGTGCWLPAGTAQAPEGSCQPSGGLCSVS
jgi:hypothetical protein